MPGVFTISGARKGRGLGASDTDHAAVGKRHVDDAWNDLERMPPTCRGGIDVASRALASAERGLAHLHSIEHDRVVHNDLFALGNRAANAARKTLDFFASVCEAPHGEARNRPLFHRAEPPAPKRKSR